MALNSYYRTEPDPIWDRFREDSKNHAAFFDGIRDYLLEEHSSNLTQFIELCEDSLCTLEYWESLAESGKDPRQIIDDIVQDRQMLRQQRYIENVIIGGKKI